MPSKQGIKAKFKSNFDDEIRKEKEEEEARNEELLEDVKKNAPTVLIQVKDGTVKCGTVKMKDGTTLTPWNIDFKESRLDIFNYLPLKANVFGIEFPDEFKAEMDAIREEAVIENSAMKNSDIPFKELIEPYCAKYKTKLVKLDKDKPNLFKRFFLLVNANRKKQNVIEELKYLGYDKDGNKIQYHLVCDGCCLKVVRNSEEHDEMICDESGKMWFCSYCAADGRAKYIIKKNGLTLDDDDDDPEWKLEKPEPEEWGEFPHLFREYDAMYEATKKTFSSGIYTLNLTEEQVERYTKSSIKRTIKDHKTQQERLRRLAKMDA